MQPRNMDYSAVETTAKGDHEEDGVSQASPTAKAEEKIGHSLFGWCGNTQHGSTIVHIIIIFTFTISLTTAVFGFSAVNSMNNTVASIIILKILILF